MSTSKPNFTTPDPTNQILARAQRRAAFSEKLRSCLNESRTKLEFEESSASKANQNSTGHGPIDWSAHRKECFDRAALALGLSPSDPWKWERRLAYLVAWAKQHLKGEEFFLMSPAYLLASIEIWASCGGKRLQPGIDINSQTQPDHSDSIASADRTEAPTTILNAEEQAGVAPSDSRDSRSDPLPNVIAHAQLCEFTPTTEREVSGHVARTKPPDQANRTEADRRALVIGTAGLPTGNPPELTLAIASNSKLRKLVEEHPELSPLANQLAQVERAQAEAEVAFREGELTEQWGMWSGVHPWDDKPDLTTTDCPWWIAGAEYVFRIAVTWRTHYPSTPDRAATLLSQQVEVSAKWMYWNRVFVHDCLPAPNSKVENFLSERNAKRFANFALLFCLRRFAERDLEEWRKRAALLTARLLIADGRLVEREQRSYYTEAQDRGEAIRAAAALDDAIKGDVKSTNRKKRGRPTEISDELKEKALRVQGGKARAQILYQTKRPTVQQVKNVTTILRHYRRKRQPNQG
jgi:hypothetical protein